MIKCVLFDLDGTLADTVESIAVAGNKALEMVGLRPQPVEKYNYFAGDGADTLIKRALKASGDEDCSLFEMAYSEYKKFFELDCTYHVTPFPGIKEMLGALKSRGIKIGVISNKPHLRSIDVVESLFGRDYFDIIVGHKEGFPKKPDPASTIAAAKELGFMPNQCIYVGDTNVDMKNGMAAKMSTIGVLWGFRKREELEAFSPQAIIEKPEEILNYLI
ncbi:MAG: HAD family hydrolase [Velocimicrobium sp.]